jgi:hypothetical protein
MYKMYAFHTFPYPHQNGLLFFIQSNFNWIGFFFIIHTITLHQHVYPNHNPVPVSSMTWISNAICYGLWFYSMSWGER